MHVDNRISRSVAKEYRKALTNLISPEVPIKKDPVAKVLFSEDSIQQQVMNLGSQLAIDYADKEPVFIGILSGAFVFMADLIRNVYPRPEGMVADFMRVRSYDGTSTESNKAPNIFEISKFDIKDRHVVIVEDIIDTGHTLRKLVDLIQSFGVASVEVCVLLDKECRREVEVDVKYSGFDCPDEFVVGYGLDYNEKYRNYPYVFRLNPSCI